MLILGATALKQTTLSRVRRGCRLGNCIAQRSPLGILNSSPTFVPPVMLGGLRVLALACHRFIHVGALPSFLVRCSRHPII